MAKVATSGARRVRIRTMSAKELKNRTGEAMRAIGRHERVLVTRRGKPFAAIVPIDQLPQSEDPDELLEQLRDDARKNPVPFTFDEYMTWSRGPERFLSTLGRSRSSSRSGATRARR